MIATRCAVGAQAADWLLEVAASHDGHRAWISDPQRYVVGFGKGSCQVDAVRAALFDAGTHYRADHDALAAMEKSYFGQCGSLAYCT